MDAIGPEIVEEIVRLPFDEAQDRSRGVSSDDAVEFGHEEGVRRRRQSKSISESGSDELLCSWCESVSSEEGEQHDEIETSSGIEIDQVKWKENVFLCYLPLYKATLMGQWEVAETIFKHDSAAITADITVYNETPLHIAVSTCVHLDFVEKLVNLMCKRSLPLTQMNVDGRTAFVYAAIFGNVKAAEILVGKNQMLPSISDGNGISPLLHAAENGHKEMILYLLSVTKDEGLFMGIFGARLLNSLISYRIYDLALDILSQNPMLAVEEDQYGNTALILLAQQPNVFEGESQLGFCQRLLYRCFSVKLIDAPLSMQRGDVENPSKILSNKDSSGALYQLLTFIRRAIFQNWASSYLKNVHDTKLMHMQACALVKRVCEEALNVEGTKYVELFSISLFLAAKMGTLEVAAEILRVHPCSILRHNNYGHNIFHVAVLHRREQIYNLLYQITPYKNLFTALDIFGNNILHLAGELVPSDKISGAALQMQRELQWFEEVEGIMKPSHIDMKNRDGKTARRVFSEKHQYLVRQGEVWMKSTASACTVVAALIATVAFAAVFTAPGGNNDDRGFPILAHRKSFMVFAAADALALITSSVSVMMFLGILTSRYSEKDFLKFLPTKLIIGLTSLFISIASMVAAFSASLYLLLVHQVTWVAVPIIIFAFIPVTLFARLQFPLLFEMISSTYGRSIFGSHGKKMLF